MSRFGVIDLGTNTFHLLIIELGTDGAWNEIYRERIFVKLAEDGIQKIGTNAYKRGFDALHHFYKILNDRQVKKFNAIGTAALRTASNGKDFIQDVKNKIGLNIQLIPGKEEAKLIHIGVAKAVDIGTEKGLIMDIGGGSVEFIIADKNKVFWAESFPIGAAVLHNHFHKKEPIHPAEIEILHTHLDATLSPLFEVLKKHKTPLLIGASGTFDVLENLLPLIQKTKLSATIDEQNFHPLYRKIIKMTMEERRTEADIPTSRADMIVVALVLIDFIIKKAAIQKIIVSAYAMKEGILSEMIKS